MIITQISLTEKAVAERDYCNIYVIEIDGKTVFSVSDGDPEDNNLSRNFNDVYGLLNLLIRVHEAGTKGEKLIIEQKEVEEY